MNYILLESESKFDIENDRDETIQYLKRNCSQAINEFYKKNIPLFRGMDFLIKGQVYSLKPREERPSTEGILLSSPRIFRDFDTVLRKHGHASRKFNTVFTTTSDIDSYTGIPVSKDRFFCFIPFDGYKYSYHRKAKHDLNMIIDDYDSLSSIKRLNLDFHNLIEMDVYSVRPYYRSLMNNNELKKDKDFKYFYDVIEVAEDFRKFHDSFNSLLDNEDVNIIKSLERFKKIEKPINNLNKRVEILANDDRAREKFPESMWGVESVDILSIVNRQIDKFIQFLSRIDDMIDAVNEFMGDVVTNKISPQIKDNEVWFNTKNYVLIHPEDLNEIIKELIK